MTTTTYCILIGNSDDKLSQGQWHSFVTEVDTLVCCWATSVQFSGGSSFDRPWQNACWVIEKVIDENEIIALELGTSELFDPLGELCEKYGQNSIAVVVGRTWFAVGRGRKQE